MLRELHKSPWRIELMIGYGKYLLVVADPSNADEVVLISGDPSAARAVAHAWKSLTDPD